MTKNELRKIVRAIMVEEWRGGMDKVPCKVCGAAGTDSDLGPLCANCYGDADDAERERDIDQWDRVDAATPRHKASMRTHGHKALK